MDVEIRPVTDGELDDAVRAVMASYGQHARDDDLEDARALAELDRTIAAFHGGRCVGLVAAISFELTVPGGGAVRAAGFTDVGVLPTHRRRGVLTALMARQLRDSRDRGEPVSALVALCIDLGITISFSGCRHGSGRCGTVPIHAHHCLAASSYAPGWLSA